MLANYFFKKRLVVNMVSKQSFIFQFGDKLKWPTSQNMFHIKWQDNCKNHENTSHLTQDKVWLKKRRGGS